MSDLIDDELKVNRPNSIVVLAVLSLLNMGYNLITSFIAMARGPLNSEELQSARVEYTKSINSFADVEGGEMMQSLMREMIAMTETLNAHYMMNIATSIIFVLVGVAGVILMLRQKKIGFHAYIIYSFLISVQIYFFMKPSLLTNSMVIMNLLISALFIFQYSRSLKWMK